MSKRSYIRNYYPLRLFIVLILISVIVGFIPALLIVLQRNLIDAAIQGASDGVPGNFIICLFQFTVLVLLGSLLKNIHQFGLSRRSLIVAKKLDSQRVEKCRKVSFPITETQYFHELCAQAEKAAETDGLFFEALHTGVKSAVQILTSFVVLYSIDVQTAIVTCVLLFLGILINKNAARNSGNIWSEYTRNMRHANYFSSLLLHREYAMERKIFNFHQEIEKRYKSNCSEAIRKNSQLGRKRLRAECLVTLFSVIYSMAAILLLIPPVKNGMVSLGGFFAAFTAIGSLRSVAGQLYGAVFDSSSCFSKLSGFFSLLELDEEKNDNTDGQIDLSKGIEFRQVSFTYPGSSSPVLDKISFTLREGMHYALVGENGCGKTTLVKLLMGLYQPTGGHIFVGGKNVSKLSSEERKQLFTAIFQDFYRYPFSIREIVSLSAEKAFSEEMIHNALDLLHFEAPIRRAKKGLDKSLGYLKQEGGDLSGGEWQKLTVARSLLSEAPLVVLDEPNAALDPVSEMAFYGIYEEIFKSKTTLFISHRLGAVKSADKILVLHDKHLIAMDSHNVLMRTCAYYRELYETQRGLYHGA